jgi:AraC-like DNA-binding protein
LTFKAKELTEVNLCLKMPLSGFIQQKGKTPMSVYAPGMINLWRTIESYGIDPAPLFAAENIEVKLPIDPCKRLPYEKIDRIRAAAVKATGDEAIGLRSASVYLPSQLGALGYAWHASLTLRRAFMRLERFVRLVNDKARVGVEDRDGCMVATLSVEAPSQSETARDDGALALITRMSRLISGEQFRLQTVNFRHGAPRDIKPYFEFFACELNFDQAENQLLIPLSLVDETLIGANPELALMNDKVVTRRLALIDKNDIVARVRAILVDQLPLGNLSDETVADAMHMSVRTMHRRLADVGSNFRALLVEMRQSLAEAYILDNSLTLTEISLLLGFSEPSSFSRAYKSWTGNAPSEARQSNM